MGMGVVIDPQKLRRELARRGWTAADLARDSGPSTGLVTMTQSAGQPFRPRTIGSIGMAYADFSSVARCSSREASPLRFRADARSMSRPMTSDAEAAENACTSKRRLRR